jgi:hypothetical protein
MKDGVGQQPSSNQIAVSVQGPPARKKSRRDTPLAAVLAELADIGVKPSAISRNKHVKLRWSHRGLAHITVCPASASDRRAARNAAAFVRRQIAGRRP